MTVVETTHRLEALLNEYRVISTRMGVIRKEVKGICVRLDAQFRPKLIQVSSPIRPRPLQDKLAISVGRTIVAGIKAGWDRERTTAEAVKKATRIAQKNGLDELSVDFRSRIEQIVKKRMA